MPAPKPRRRAVHSRTPCLFLTAFRLHRFWRHRPPFAAVQVGQIVTLANGQVAILRSVDDEGVIIDCNHPLAGAMRNKTLSSRASSRSL